MMHFRNVIKDKARARDAMPALDALSKGDIKVAINLARELIAAEDNVAAYSYTLSEVLSEAGLTDEALEHAENAHKLDPTNAHISSHYAKCLMMQGQFNKAQLEAERASISQPDHVLTYVNIGMVLTGCGQLEAALDAYQQAVSLDSRDLTLQYNLATALRNVGHMSDAEAIYDRVISERPHDWEAYRNRSDLRRQTNESNHVAEMEARLPQAKANPRGEFQLLGALAKELSDLDEYKRSFSYLKRSADLRRSFMNYNVAGDVQTMASLAKAYHASVFEKVSGFLNEEPIFIIGLPRTGTTLFERMLGSHSEVFAAGELQNFSVEFVKLAKTTFAGEALDKISLVEKSKALNFKTLGENYIASTRPRTGNTRLFIDKMPLNFLYAGLIHLALPKAKIIHLTRHPMDACYAIYKTPFDQAYPYSYDLSDLAQYYIAYRELMQHWHNVMPGQIIDIAYEDVVQDPEAQIRKALSHCGLEWEEACLSFHESKAPTNTASAAQVRQPIYTSSVAKWKHVEEGLRPLREKLEAAGIEI